MLLDIARSDREAASLLAQRGFTAQALFFYEQSFEKALKSLWAFQLHALNYQDSEVVELFKKQSHNNRRSLGDLIEGLARGSGADNEELKKITQFRRVLEKTRFKEEKLLREYAQYVVLTYVNYQKEAADHSFAEIWEKFLYLAWTLAWDLAFVEDASRYPLSKYNFQNVELLNHKKNRRACEALDAMVRDFLDIVVFLAKIVHAMKLRLAIL